MNKQGSQEKQTGNGQIIHVKNSMNEEVNRQTGEDIAAHLVELASRIPNVNDATAVVIGKYAIVGIDVKADIERSEVGSIKFSVAESLKKDPYGANAVVIADPDMTARLKEIREDIRSGAPIQGVMNELADITGRLMPEIPADIIDPHKKKNDLEKPQKTLNKKEDQRLEKEQQEQSEHHLKPNKEIP